MNKLYSLYITDAGPAPEKIEARLASRYDYDFGKRYATKMLARLPCFVLTGIQSAIADDKTQLEALGATVVLVESPADINARVSNGEYDLDSKSYIHDPHKLGL